MKKILLISTLLISYGTVFAQDSKNNDQDCSESYFYHGYNVILANNTTDTSTPWGNRIFDLLTPTCQPDLGDIWYYHDVTFDEASYQENILSSLSRYQDAFFEKIAFTGSQEFEYQRNEVFGKSLINIQSSARTRTGKGYGIYVDLGDFYPPEVFTADFLSAIESFPISTDNPDWFAQVKIFFDDYGTHVAEVIYYGAVWSYESQYTRENYDYLLSTGGLFNGLDNAADYYRTEGMVEYTEWGQLVASLAEKNRSLSVGAKPPKTASSWLNEWNEEARKAPAPYAFELEKISALLNAEFFPNDPDIDAKRLVMEEGYLQYCESVPYCHEVQQ
ncbi:MAG: MAC/perforin domain-containing protein [Legionellales bacterium]|jgi:hypothetical protein